MKNVFKNLMKKKHHLIVDEGDVIDIVNEIRSIIDGRWLHKKLDIGNWGRSNQYKLFINFSCSTKIWNRLINKINIKRVSDAMEIPNNRTKCVYEID